MVGAGGRAGQGEEAMEEPDPDDPSDFTGEDLEGRRLTLRNTGEEGSATVIELRFGEGNRFEQIESVGEQAATRAEGAASRSGSYTYQRTGSRMGTVRLTYDDGSSCEVLLAFTEAGAGTFAYDCGEGDPEEGSFRLTTGSLFVPVILSAAGQNQSFFTSELTLTNRGEREVRLDYAYTADLGGGSGRASEVLGAGRQRVETDALTYLRGLGIAIPETGNRIGTLRVEVRLGSEVEAVVRTTTVVPEGRAGLAYLGVAEEEGFDEPVYLCGLRQNSRGPLQRGLPEHGSGGRGCDHRGPRCIRESDGCDARVLEEVTLEPGGFHQYSGLLGVLESVEGNRQGYVKVERVEGTAPFYAYGVINDQANSDGSFVFPVTASSLEGKMGQTLPVVVETSEFTSELTVTNFSQEPRRLDFQFVSEGIETDDQTAGFSMAAGSRPSSKSSPSVVDELRRQGVAGSGVDPGLLRGTVFATAVEGDMSGIVIGARTGSEGGGGQYSVFYNAVPGGEAFTEEAWVDGLQQNAGEPEQPGAGQHRGGGWQPERLPSRDLRRGDGIAGRDGGHQADPGPGLASDQRHSGQIRPGDPAGVYPDREGVRRQPVPGLRGGQRRQGYIRIEKRSLGRTCPPPSWPTGWSTTAGPRDCLRGSRR